VQYYTILAPNSILIASQSPRGVRRLSSARPQTNDSIDTAPELFQGSPTKKRQKLRQLPYSARQAMSQAAKQTTPDRHMNSGRNNEA